MIEVIRPSGFCGGTEPSCARVLDGALKALGSKLRTFRNAVDNAEALEGAGNKLDAKANAAEVDDAARIRQYLTAHGAGLWPGGGGRDQG